MKGYTTENIRNIALLGHGGTGKTTFLEAALLATGVINRLGKVEDGNTVSDFDKMEIEKGYSISLSVVPVEYNETKINFLDTPGVFDFVGEVNSAIKAAEAAAIFVDASSGIQVGTEKAWDICQQHGTPRFFVINKIEKEHVNLDEVIESLKDKFGTSVVTLDDEDALMEAIAETDEVLMEKYFEGEEFTPEEFTNGLMNGIAAGEICPIMARDARRRSSRPTSARPCESTASRSWRAEPPRWRMAVATTCATGAGVSSQIESASSTFPPSSTLTTPSRKSW